MKRFSSIIGLLLIISCAGEKSKESTEVEEVVNPEEVITAIEEANTRITELIRQGKIEEASENFMPDVVQLISGQPPIEGRGAWIGMQNTVKEFGEWQLDLEVLDVEIGKDMAVERGRGIQTFTANANSPMPSFIDTGNYMVLWKKVDDDWKIQWDYVIIE